MAKVVCGANEQEVQPGMTVGEVKNAYKEVLNIDDNSEIILNGDRVGDEYVLLDTDKLEFLKKAGDKG